MGFVNTTGLNGLAKTPGLTSAEAETVENLVLTLKANLARNRERTQYYDGEQGIKNIGIAIPDELLDLRISCSWPAKAVDALADRSVFDGLSLRSGKDASEINDIFMHNHFSSMYDKAKRTEGIHGVSFWTVSRAKLKGMPPIIRHHSAECASAVWDDKRNHIDAGLVVAAYDRRPGEQQRPTLVNVYTNEAVLVFEHVKNSSWTVVRNPHLFGRPLMEAMVHAPTTSKPLGTSRISRAVMSITDCAMREYLRSEIHAEIFTSPQKYLIGASEKQMNSLNRYDATYGAIFGLEFDEDAPSPEFGQLNQASMEPHISYMRQLAAQFAGATDVPISTLGVIHDNPSSAEAIHASEQPLVIKAESFNANNAIAIESVAHMALAISRNSTLEELPADESCIIAGFRRPDRPSPLSDANAAMMISNIEGMRWFGETEVCQEMLGFNESQRIRMRAEKQRSETAQALGAFMQQKMADEKQAELDAAKASDGQAEIIDIQDS